MYVCPICNKPVSFRRTYSSLKKRNIQFEEVHGNEYKTHIILEGGIEAIVKHDLGGENPYIGKLKNTEESS